MFVGGHQCRIHGQSLFESRPGLLLLFLLQKDFTQLLSPGGPCLAFSLFHQSGDGLARIIQSIDGKISFGQSPKNLLFIWLTSGGHLQSNKAALDVLQNLCLQVCQTQGHLEAMWPRQVHRSTQRRHSLCILAGLDQQVRPLDPNFRMRFISQLALQGQQSGPQSLAANL